MLRLNAHLKLPQGLIHQILDVSLFRIYGTQIDFASTCQVIQIIIICSV